MVEIAASPRARSVRTTLRRSFVDSHVPLGVAACLVVGCLAFSNGGYFPVAWGWAGLALLWVLAVGLALDSPPRPDGANASSSQRRRPGGVDDAVARLDRKRAALGARARADARLSGRSGCRRAARPSELRDRPAGRHLGGGDARRRYGLATRLFPDQLGVFDPIAGYQLSEPVGYWNAFGVLAGMGVLIALGLAARGGPVVRCLAGGSTVSSPHPLLHVQPRRLDRAVRRPGRGDRGRPPPAPARHHRARAAPWTVIAIWAASTSPSLTRQTAALGAAARDGHGLAVIAIGLVVAAALAMLVLDWAEEKVSPSHALRSSTPERSSLSSRRR